MPLSLFFIVLASLSVAIGSYFISNVITQLSLYNGFSIFSAINYKLLTLGIALNLTGSIFWIFGRAGFSSYLFAWCFYLSGLVFFGAIISLIISQNMPSVQQLVGMTMLVIALSLLQ